MSSKLLPALAVPSIVLALSACSTPAAVEESGVDQWKFSPEQIAATSLNVCYGAEGDDLRAAGWEIVEFEEGMSASDFGLENAVQAVVHLKRFGAYEGSEWGTEASNYWTVTEVAGGWNVYPESAGAVMIANQYGCLADFQTSHDDGTIGLLWDDESVSGNLRD